jgi:hypothetical protein
MKWSGVMQKRALPACVSVAAWGLPSHWNAEFGLKQVVAVAACALSAIYLIAVQSRRPGHPVLPTTLNIDK